MQDISLSDNPRAGETVHGAPVGMLVRLGRGDLGGWALCMWHLVDELVESLVEIEALAHEAGGVFSVFLGGSCAEAELSGPEFGEGVYEWCGAC